MLKKKIHLWRSIAYQSLENPQTFVQRCIWGSIIFLIFSSILLLAFEYSQPEIFAKYQKYFSLLGWFFTIAFLIEYCVRVLVTPKPLKYIFGFYGIVDALAIFPMLITGGVLNLNALRGIWLLRLLRALRLIKLYYLQSNASKVFGRTILAQVAPVIFWFFSLKLAIFFLETKGWWVDPQNLETTFGVIGFAISVILVQKLGVGYTKIIVVEDSILKIAGTLKFLKMYPVSGIKDLHGAILSHLKTGKGREKIWEVNKNLGDSIGKIKSEVDRNFALQSFESLQKEIFFLLSRMEIETDPVYDKFLRNITLLYSFLICVFLPGFLGLVSVVLATYVLGGMYMVIENMDRAIGFGDRKSLINADFSDFEKLSL